MIRMATVWATVIVSTLMARANAELEILVGSTVVYNSGTLVGTSAVNDSYSYTSGTTSFSLLYGWNNSVRVGNGLNLDNIDINSSAPVTFELSDNDNPTTGGVYLYLVGQGSVSGSVSSYCSAGNLLLAPTTLLNRIAVVPGEPYGLTPHSLGVPGPYSLTEILTVTGTITGADNLTVAMNLVPDGGWTLSMLGLGLLGVAAVRNRFT
jgi:hypothetical protein